MKSHHEHGQSGKWKLGNWKFADRSPIAVPLRPAATSAGSFELVQSTHDRNQCAASRSGRRSIETLPAVTCGGASSAPVTGITSRITAAARLLHGASCASAAMRRRAQRRCKCRRRPRLLWSRRAFRISGFPGSAFRDSLWIREVPKIETFLSFQVPRFQNADCSAL